jgi:deoxyribodipyrimidine photo-lyase
VSQVPGSRITILNDRPPNHGGRFVVYWMIAARRPRWNFGLQRAAEIAAALGRPLVVFEPLRCDYPWASDRLHSFVLDGMRANAAAFGGRAFYYPYVEGRKGEGKGLLRALDAHACAIVTDTYPGFFLPAMVAAAARQIQSRLEAVDSNGLIPLADHGRAFPTARGYRAFVQRELPAHLRAFPDEDPLADTDLPPLDRLPLEITRRWPAANGRLRSRERAAWLAALPIDHGVAPVKTEGGCAAAGRALRTFVGERLAAYGREHNHPDADATSRLSPYLHFGHISAHEVFAAVMTRERWTTRKLAAGRSGAREGWWGVSTSAEMFLDQLVVWRELAFNGSARIPGFDTYDTLPAWARRTIEAHAGDPRPRLYDEETLEHARTDDEVWNAAQRQLRTDGWFHGYARMLWGKKIFEWSAEPAESLRVMERLMNRYSLDGRDPVSYASFGWVLGRYDRPWFERPVFGTVRYMTSASARRKLKMKAWLARYGPGGASRI